jgi:hypothetical protein
MVKNDLLLTLVIMVIEKLGALVENLNYIEVDKRKPNDESHIYHMYIRFK